MNGWSLPRIRYGDWPHARLYGAKCNVGYYYSAIKLEGVRSLLNINKVLIMIIIKPSAFLGPKLLEGIEFVLPTPRWVFFS